MATPRHRGFGLSRSVASLWLLFGCILAICSVFSGWIDGWVDGWMNGCIHVYMYIHTSVSSLTLFHLHVCTRRETPMLFFFLFISTELRVDGELRRAASLAHDEVRGLHVPVDDALRARFGDRKPAKHAATARLALSED